MPTETKLPLAEAIARAHADYAAAVGTVIDAKCVIGYKGNDSVEVYPDPPARVRVEATPHEDIEHFNDDYLDPYWNVTLVESHPALEGVRSLWVDGPSYQIAKPIYRYTPREIKESSIPVKQ